MRTDLDKLRNSSVFAEEALVIDVQSFLHSMMEEKGMSRAQLADAMGVSRARVTQMFSAECKNFTLRLLARAFFALGERAELTCDLHRKMQRRTAMFGAMQVEAQLVMDVTWERAFEGPVNDNGIGIRDAEVEVATASDPRRVGNLVASMSKVFERQRAA